MPEQEPVQTYIDQIKTAGISALTEALTSKKTWCVIFGMLVLFGWIPIQEPQRTQVLYLCMTYVLGQGLADIGKSAMKIQESTNEK
jgi:hypothetical protein